MNDTRETDTPVQAPAGQARLRRPRIPALVIYTVVVLLLVLMIVVFVPKALTTHKDVQTRFLESLVEVKGNRGDVLEVATYKSTALFSESDKLDTTVLGIRVPLGTTEAFMMVPVTYRFHVLLSDRWVIRTTPETVTVIAPELRPSMPPAPDISLMEVKSESGWARFNRKDVEERVKSMVTGKLKINAARLARSEVIRDAARKSVEGSLRKYVRWLPEACRNKVFTVKFGDEWTDGEATPRLEREQPADGSESSTR